MVMTIFHGTLESLGISVRSDVDSLISGKPFNTSEFNSMEKQW